MKRFLLRILILCTAALCLFSACSADPTHGKSPDPAAITAKIQKEIRFPEMLEVKPDRLSKYYTIPQDVKLDSLSVFISSSSASASEVAVFKAGDSADTKKIKQAVDARVKQKAGVFQDYGAPQEYKDIQDCVVEIKGPYVFLAVCPDSAKARSIFDEFFK